MTIIANINRMQRQTRPEDMQEIRPGGLVWDRAAFDMVAEV